MLVRTLCLVFLLQNTASVVKHVDLASVPPSTFQ